MKTELTPDLVRRVRDLIAPHVRRTPLLRSDWLSSLSGGEVYLKCENLQVTGSFKVRGGLAAVALLDPEARSRGVVTASAGNHGLGLAHASSVFGISCKVVVSQTVPKVKEDGIRALGAEVIRAPHVGYDATQAWTLSRLDDLGGTYVSAFEDSAVMAGNGGTTFLEVDEEIDDLEAMVVPCGGGGMVCGVGMMAHDLRPDLQVIGVNTDASPGMWLSRRDGRAHLEVESAPTIAEGIEGGVGELTYDLGRTLIDDMIVVREKALRRSVADVARYERMIVEGAGAAGVAALVEGALHGRKVCVFLTGANIDTELLYSLLRETFSEPGS
jgi:threonine dehydratase